MSTMRTVAVIVGSLRRESFSRRMAQALIALAPPALRLGIVEISPLGLYNQDFDDNPPAEWLAFKEQVKAADAVLFVTPEYNRSVPGVLKNAIDIGSRPYGQSAWNAKPAAIVSLSPSALGGFGANHHLRQVLVALNVPVLAQPEAYIGNAAKLFDAAGQIAVDSTRDYLQKFLQTFAAWVEANAKA